MNKFLSILCLGIALMGANVSLAQLSSPQPSPSASVMQTFGLTEVKITYSAPGVKGREIWGKLLPYDSLWRAGANSPTRISFSTDVTINGQEVKEGEYSLYAIPTQGDWTFILGEDKGGNGVFSYKKEEDVLRFPVKVKTMSESQERLAYHINPDSDEQATVTLRWEKIAAPFAIKADLKKILNTQASNFLSQNWFSTSQTAQYLAQNEGDLEVASKLADAALGMAGENLVTAWVKAQVLAKQDKKAEAIAWGKKAKEMGDASSGGFLNFYNTNVKEPLAKALAEWQ